MRSVIKIKKYIGFNAFWLRTSVAAENLTVYLICSAVCSPPARLQFPTSKKAKIQFRVSENTVLTSVILGITS